MAAFLADEDFNNDIVRGLRRRNPAIDLVRVQDVGLSGGDDPTVLEWAAQAGRLVVTHDVNTMSHHAYERVRDGNPMPGVIEVGRHVPMSVAIDDLLLIGEGSLPANGKVR